MEGTIKVHLDPYSGIWPLKDVPGCEGESLIRTAPALDFEGTAVVELSCAHQDGELKIYFNGGVTKVALPPRTITETFPCGGPVTEIDPGGQLFDDADFGTITDLRANHQGGPLVNDEYDYTAHLSYPGGTWVGLWTHHLHVKLNR